MRVLITVRTVPSCMMDSPVCIPAHQVRCPQFTRKTVRWITDRRGSAQHAQPVYAGFSALPQMQAKVPHGDAARHQRPARSEEHTSELQSLMRTAYAVFCLKKKKKHIKS